MYLKQIMSESVDVVNKKHLHVVHIIDCILKIYRLSFAILC